MSRRFSLLIIASLVATTLYGTGAAHAAASCAAASTGGEWRTFGHDLSNTHAQPLEDQITPSTATGLTPKWTFSIAGGGEAGGFQSVPVVADGCVFVGTNTGTVFALNADTGAVVWKTNFASSPLLAGLSGGIFSVAVDNGRVFADVSALGSPYAAALDEATGTVLWQTVVDHSPDAYTNSGVQIIEGNVFIGISGGESADPYRHPGGFALLDPADGHIVVRSYTTSAYDDARGNQGGSMWGTPVYDPSTGFFYDGTGQPSNKARECTMCNAIVKVDARPDSPTFGQIVDSYKGDHDENRDLDFGGSPVMFHDSHGNEIVGAQEKSGVFHAAFADDMQQAWWNRTANPDEAFLGNAGSPATDGSSVFIASNTATVPQNPGTPGNAGKLYALNVDDGTTRWSFPVASGVDYHPIATAGGVVYMVTTTGVFLGVDALNGIPVVARPMAADVGDACANLSSGVAIARHTVFAQCDTGVVGGGWLVAYAANPAVPALPADPNSIPAPPVA